VARSPAQAASERLCARRLGKTAGVRCLAPIEEDVGKRMPRFRPIQRVLPPYCFGLAPDKGNAVRKRVEFPDSNALTDQTRGIEDVDSNANIRA
jgi:hypothetical protein